ncbi:MAG: hypothetical protein JXM69_15275 [Anaerolineae bacterium]|nr:hypothetical protein [Anaerolineae bacterium]
MYTDYIIEESWGVYINNRGYIARSVPDACQKWDRPKHKNAWQEKGVVIWSNEAQKVETLSANHALQFLEFMQTSDTWQTEGVPIITQHVCLTLPDPPHKKRSRKKGQPEAEEPAQQDDSKPETVIKEQFRLNPQAGAKFLELLQANKSLLQQMAEADERERQKAWEHLYGFFLRGAREREVAEIDFSTRQFKWEQDKNTLTWTCDRPPNRGTVFLADDSNFFWQGCIEQPDQFKHRSPLFVELVKALTWVEQELEKIEQGVDELTNGAEQQWRRIPRDELIAQKRTELAACWIEPAALEPERITYQAVIDLEYEPYTYKTWEMSFGKQFRYEEKFASPTQLAKELQLDPIQVDIEQHINGRYQIISRVSYYQPETAAAQAQQIWDKSAIVKQYAAGKVIRARYGYFEVETGYEIMLAGCENSKRPYPPPKSREEHMIWLALEDTLEYALDVDGYRAYCGFGPKFVSDEKVLEIMHSHRARSPHVPLEEQMKSELWLRTHGAKQVKQVQK